MGYIYDKKRNKIIRVAIPIVKRVPEQTSEMKKYLQRLMEEYKDIDWDKEIKEASKKELKPLKL
jgi:hypothetical protein